jgi:hypothetical protein
VRYVFHRKELQCLAELLAHAMGGEIRKGGGLEEGGRGEGGGEEGREGGRE